MCMCVPAWLHVFHIPVYIQVWMQVPTEAVKEYQIPFKLELQVAVSNHMAVGDSTCILVRASSILNSWAISAVILLAILGKQEAQIHKL